MKNTRDRIVATVLTPAYIPVTQNQQFGASKERKTRRTRGKQNNFCSIKPNAPENRWRVKVYPIDSSQILSEHQSQSNHNSAPIPLPPKLPHQAKPAWLTPWTRILLASDGVFDFLHLRIDVFMTNIKVPNIT
jgi:hypothetical protein